jgi:nitrate reductase gamma subunit
MKLFIYLVSYLVFIVTLARVCWKTYLIMTATGREALYEKNQPLLISLPKGLLEVVFLGRLFRSSPLIWFGEWVFHISLLTVLFIHLRFFAYPVPSAVFCLYPFSSFTGIVMVGSLVYIMVVKVLFKKVDYVSRYNLLLISLIGLLGVSGLAMRYIHRIDIIQVKVFTMGLVTFRPEGIPLDILFLVHYSGFLLFLLLLPTHLFTAPVLITFASARESGFKEGD